MDKTSQEFKNTLHHGRIDEPEITLKNYRGIFHMRSSGMENIELMETLTKCLKSASSEQITEHLKRATWKQ